MVVSSSPREPLDSSASLICLALKTVRYDMDTVNKARNVLGMVNIIATKLSAYCPQLALPSCIRLIILWITNFEPLGVSPTCPSFCYHSKPPSPLFFLSPSPTLSGRIFLMISLSGVLYKKSLPFTICWNLFLSILGLIDFCFLSFSCNR